MKKIFGIALVLAVLTTLCFGSVALAADPTNVNVTWSGTGAVGGTVTAGSTLATTNWSSVGNAISGTFTAHYEVRNPGDVSAKGSNHYTTSMDAQVSDGGWIDYYTTRGTLGSVAQGDASPHPGGNQSYSYVEAYGTGSSAVMTTRSAVSAFLNASSGHSRGIADLTRTQPSAYSGPALGYTVTNASSFLIIRTLTASDGTYTGIGASGSGDARLYNIASVADTASSFCGGHPSAGEWHTHYQAFSADNGAGILQIQGLGNNSVTLTSLAHTNGDPATSSFASNGTLTIVGSGLRATGANAVISQFVGWDSATYGAFNYNQTPIQSN